MRKKTNIHFYATLLACILFSACSTSTPVTSFSTPEDSLRRKEGPGYAYSENTHTRQWNLEHPPSIKEISRAVREEKTEEQLEGIGEWWFFGPGLGHSILNIGTVVVFPPYAIYLLGNAGLALAGKEPVRIINILPSGGPREVINDSIDGICSVPGRLTAAAGRRPYIEHLPHIPTTEEIPYNELHETELNETSAPFPESK
jgi:hypothetical protein